MLAQFSPEHWELLSALFVRRWIPLQLLTTAWGRPLKEHGQKASPQVSGDNSH
ncbi:hypothetical protein FA13DRAFT_1727380 [Coprinellus micaceus]|uniref:Uncharacterized protein n=1 Tax=Coprinellus micaceus TaxID=71717 RepID=A0A4Y7TS90_COPMI|nr:hypothetical protein FA13DRAFT_1727380 [Coprinellus micaceus]